MRWLMKIAAVVGLLLHSPLTAPGVTTQAAIPVTTVEQAVYDYDASSVRVVSGNVSTDSDVSGPIIPSFGPVAGFVAPKRPVLGETALKGVGDDMLVHFSQTGNRASIAANGVTTEGASYFYRVGDVRNLTAAQVRGAIGPLARGGVDNSLAVIVPPEAASFTRVQMVLPEYVTMQNSVPSVLIRQVPGGAP